MSRLTRTLVGLAVRLVPPQERVRYAEEFDADLQALTGWRAFLHAVSLLLGMPRLRWEVLTRVAGGPVPYCFVGLHRDVTVHPNREDLSIVDKECILCHRTRDTRQYARRQNPRGLGANMGW